MLIKFFAKLSKKYKQSDYETFFMNLKDIDKD